MRRISPDEISKALLEVGTAPGQVLYLQTDLSIPGPIAGVDGKENFCKAYLDALLDAVGAGGTLVVPAFSTQVARNDEDFIWEETPTMLGLFPEYFRRHRDSLRSLHPLHSLCAMGPLKERICTDNGPSDFGWQSPFHRLLEEDARILTIGLQPSFAVAIANLIEALYCVPYNYNKLLKWRPIINGKASERQFVSNARHLHLNTCHDLRRFAAYAEEQRLLTSAPLGSSVVRMSRVAEVFEAGVEFLSLNPYGMLLGEPSFEYGILPYDGPTKGRDGIS